MNRKLLMAGSLIGALSFAATSSATPTIPGPANEPSAFEQAIRDATAEMLRPGPRQADWNKNGVDLEAEIAGLPGGVLSNYLLSTDKDGDKTVIIFSNVTSAELIPAEWSLVSEIGTTDLLGTSAPLSFGTLGRQFVLVARGSEKQVGSAFCTDKFGGAQLYDTGSAQRDDDIPPEFIDAFFKASVEILRANTLCVRHDADGDEYRSSYFLEDGRSLPAFDDFQERLKIVPAAPMTELLVLD